MEYPDYGTKIGGFNQFSGEKYTHRTMEYGVQGSYARMSFCRCKGTVHGQFFMFFILYILKMGKAVKSMPGTSWGGIPWGWKAVTGMPETCGGGIPKGWKVVTGMPGTSWGGIPKGGKAMKSMPKMVYAIQSFSCFR